MESNPFDQFDASSPAASGNPFDQFDVKTGEAAVGDPFAGDNLLSDQAIQRLQQGKQMEQSPAPSPLRGVKSYFRGVDESIGRFNRAPSAGLFGTAEAAGTLATGAIAAPVLGTIESAALGTPLEESFARYTYRPRSESGKAQLGVLGALARPLTESGADIALGPLFASESRAVGSAPAKISANARRHNPGGDSLPVQPGAVADAAASGETGLTSTATAKRAAGLEWLSAPTQSPTIQIAREAGYKLKPSESGGKAGSIAEGLSGSAKLEVALVVKNQRVTNRLAAEEIGIKGDRITPQALDKAKEPHNRVYSEVGQKLGEVATDDTFLSDIASVGRTPGTSFKNAKNAEIEKLKDSYLEERFNATDAVLETRKLRAAARKNIKAPNDPAKNELGYAQLEISNAIESQMERHGQAIGQGDLIARFRDARQALAKINSVERSLKGTDVSAAALAKQSGKVPLSGNLKTIADVANEFPNVMRDASRTKNQVPVNMTETILGVGGAVATSNPALLGAMVVRPLTRSVLMSDRYQNSLARGAPAKPQVAPKRNKLADPLNY